MDYFEKIKNRIDTLVYDADHNKGSSFYLYCTDQKILTISKTDVSFQDVLVPELSDSQKEELYGKAKRVYNMYALARDKKVLDKL